MLRSRLALVLVTTVVGLACADHQLTDPAQYSSGQVVNVTEQRLLLDSITEAVAAAIAYQPVRAKLLADFKEAPFREQKLELQSYLMSSKGAVVRNALFGGTPHSAVQFQGILERLPSIEMYMPVREHRGKWTADMDVLVAHQLRDHEDPVAYTATGQRVMLSAETPPDVPVIVLVPTETDFSRPLDMREYIRVEDNGGQSIGTLIHCPSARTTCKESGASVESLISHITDCEPDTEECEGEGNSGPGPGLGVSPAGLYMSFSHIYDLRESWPRGDPEIEVSLIGPTSNFNDITSYGCAHEGAAGYRRFNQNSSIWTGGSYGVLIADSAQIRTLQALYPDTALASNGMTVLVMEDDHERCVAHDDDAEYDTMMRKAFLFGTMAISYILLHDWQPQDDWEFLLTAATVVYTAIWLVRASHDDDLIGLAEAATVWNSRMAGESVVQTHVIQRNESRKGTINLHLRPRGFYSN